MRIIHQAVRSWRPAWSRVTPARGGFTALVTVLAVTALIAAGCSDTVAPQQHSVPNLGQLENPCGTSNESVQPQGGGGSECGEEEAGWCSETRFLITFVVRNPSTGMYEMFSGLAVRDAGQSFWGETTYSFYAFSGQTSSAAGSVGLDFGQCMDLKFTGDVTGTMHDTLIYWGW